MEENKLNNDELKEIAGGQGSGGKGDRGIIVQTTDYFSDKHMDRAIGTFREGTHVWIKGFYSGERGTCFKVTRTGYKDVFVPDGTVKFGGWDD